MIVESVAKATATLEPVVEAFAEAAAAGSPSGLAKRLTAAQESLADDSGLADMLFGPAIMAEMAGQLMVRAREDRSVKLKQPVGAFMNLPWPEAVQEFLDRGIIQESEFAPIMRERMEEAEAARALLLQRLRDKTEELAVKALDEGRTLREFRADFNALTDSLGVSPTKPSYVETVFRTNIQSAYGAGRFRAMTDPDIAEARPYVEYRTVGDSRVRDSHAALDRRVWKTTDPGWHDVMPPNGFNSIVPGTAVVGDFVGASKAGYTGVVVEIETSNRSRLTVTADHPVLTTAGFVLARDLQEGMETIEHLPTVQRLVSRSGDHRLSAPLPSWWGVDDENAPPGIQNVFDAVAREAVWSPSPGGGSVEFDGDASAGYGHIQAVAFDGELAHGADALSRELFDEPGLVSDLGAASLAGDPDGTQPVRVGHAYRFGLPPKLDALTPETVGDKRARAAVTLRQLVDGSAGEVLVSKITRLDFRTWSGHVYDLESPNGTIVANGVVVSNCRCTFVTLSREEARGKGVEVGPPEDFEPDDESFRGPPVA